ncbi:MAG: hypothetical protein UY07_C0006G0019 [Parcubacteria group bacterium GW2011_GWA1_47_8]|nr:MAG: hypothetical protein UY07_C0006G0019 [Parcubacteria group bacterium GW2011_GWA1_47_8]
MQFHIPQYIDIEDKLFGPLTFKQALYVVGGAGGAFLIYKVIPILFIAAPLILAWAVLAWALAFYPKEKLGKPFIEILEAGFGYAFGTKLYTWKKTKKDAALGAEEEFIGAQAPSVPSLSGGKLASVSFNLEVRKQNAIENSSEKK